MSMLGLQGSFLILDILSLAQDTLPFAGRNSGERIVQMVFIRFQYHLQRHFVVLVVARLVVDITIMQVPIATRRFVFIPMDLQDLSVGLLQVPNKQWGIISNNKAIFPLVFNVFVSSALLLSRGSGTGTWYGDSSNITLTGISCVTPDYVLSGTYIAIGA